MGPQGSAPQQLVQYAASSSGPKPRELFGSGSANAAPPSPKRASQRVVVPPPSDSPDMPQQRLVSEVHRLFEQDKADAEHFGAIADEINDHAQWINGLRLLILDLQQKVTAITVQAVDNDSGLKKSIAEHDSTLNEKLFKLESIVTGQGKSIEEVRGQMASGQAGVLEQLATGMQQLDAKTGESVVALENAIKEEMFKQMSETRAVVTGMGDSAGKRFDALETEVTLQAGATSAPAPPGGPQRDTSPLLGAHSVPSAAAAPPAFPHTVAGAPGLMGAAAPGATFGATQCVTTPFSFWCWLGTYGRSGIPTATGQCSDRNAATALRSTTTAALH